MTDNNIQKKLQEKPLRIGISTRALFDLEEEHKVFKEDGIVAYSNMQLKREKSLIKKGTAFNVIERLLRLNKVDEPPVVQVILLSRNSPDLSLRAFYSINEYGLNITTGSFTSGRAIGPFVEAWDLDLFLSNEQVDVAAASKAKCASAKLGLAPKFPTFDEDPYEVRIAFDGDAVVFSEESDLIFKNQGLDAFLVHEQNNANNPMNAGPFGNFLQKLSKLRKLYLAEDGKSRVRISIVTARNAPSHERVIRTLRAWGTPADEAHFVGAKEKSKILIASQAHIFFDDQEKHILAASEVVPSGHVPGPHEGNSLIIPARK